MKKLISILFCVFLFSSILNASDDYLTSFDNTIWIKATIEKDQEVRNVLTNAINESLKNPLIQPSNLGGVQSYALISSLRLLGFINGNSTNNCKLQVEQDKSVIAGPMVRISVYTNNTLILALARVWDGKMNIERLEMSPYSHPQY